MKLVINNCYGGMTEEHQAFRADPDFIKKVEDGFDGDEETVFPGPNGKSFNFGRLEHLVVVELPDETTDYYIENYDGVETVVYVVNNKIYTKGAPLYERRK